RWISGSWQAARTASASSGRQGRNRALAPESSGCTPGSDLGDDRGTVAHRVGQRVDQGVPGGLDDVVVDADGGPLPHAVSGVDEHPGGGAGAALPAEDADLVV